jgi:hypothetical protein
LRGKDVIEVELLVELRQVAVGGHGEQLGGHRGEDAVVAGGVVAQGARRAASSGWRCRRRLSRCSRQASSSSRLAYSVASRVRMRLPSGSSSSRRSFSVRRASPASTTHSSGCESKRALASRRSSESVAGLISWASSISSTGRRRAIPDGRASVRAGLEAAPAVVRAQRHAEHLAHLAVEVGEVALRMVDRPDGDIGQPARRSASRRSTTLLPVPGSPWIMAKPPSRICACSMRQQKCSSRGGTQIASVGSSVVKGFHFSP